MMVNTLLIAECGGLLVALLVVVVTGTFTVAVAEACVLTRFGRFHRVVGAGMHWKLPMDRVAAVVELRASQMKLKMATRTKDGVIITIPITIETRVNPAMVYLAWLNLPDPGPHVRALAEGVVLDRLHALTLDELFASQTGIAGRLKEKLDENLKPLGYEVIRVQVTGAVPNNLEEARQYSGRLVEAGGGYGGGQGSERSRVA